MECRKAIVKDLEEQGYLVKIEPMKHNVGSCYRCHTVIEPRVSMQWFVKMKPLAGPAIDAVKDGRHQIRAGAVRTRSISIGWRISATGAFPVSCGGATGFPPGIAKTAARLMVSREDAGRVPQMRRQPPASGRGHAGHLVFLRPVALLHPGLAGENPGAANISIPPTPW